MKPWTRIRRRWRRFKRKREAKKYALGPLREFVYLDEVSVYSLIASRKGPIATDYRDTTSTLLRSELEGTVGGNAGVAKSEIASRIESSQTTETQTVRKAVIQSTFGELYEAEKDKLVLRAGDISGASSQPANLDELRALVSGQSDRDPLILSPSDLVRGRMVEVEVELQTHEVFQFGTAVSSILDIIEGNQELTGIDTPSLRELVDGNRILQRLLAGLVPLRGRLVHYRSVVLDDQDLLVHESLFARLDAAQVNSRPVSIVGVAEQQLFWKDIRRVLFSRSQFLVLGRLTGTGLTDRWSPVKLVEVLNTIPEVGEAVAQALSALPTLMRTKRDGTTALPAGPSPLSGALAEYGSVLAKRYGQEYSTEEVAGSGSIPEEPPFDESTEARSELFRGVRDHISTKFSVEIDPQVAAEIREDVLKRAGLWPTEADLNVVPSPGPDVEPASEEEDRYIDAEFVAVYW